MLTPKRTAILAAVVLTFIYFLHTNDSALPSPSATSINGAARTAGNLKSETETAAPRATSPADATTQRPYPPKLTGANKKTSQRPLVEVASKNVREQLAYQFEYDMQGKFPAYIWQTWKYMPSQGDFGDTFRPAEASWTEQHPGFVHEVVTDRNALSLIKLLYASVPEIIEAYEALPMAVMKADLFRYLILLARGGIYSDIDTTALKSALDWLPQDIPRSSVGLVVGIEADPDREDWMNWFSRRIQFCQWTIQAKPGHPVLRDIVAKVVEDTLGMKKRGTLKEHNMEKSVIEFTGPAAWTDAIFDYMNNPKHFTMKDGNNISWQDFTGMENAKKVGDVVVLPITSFSPGVQQMGAKEPDDPMAFVHHEFEGSDRENVHDDHQS